MGLPFGFVIHLFSAICAIVPIIGLLIGTFEVAFERISVQILARIFIHILTLFLSAYLSSKEWKIQHGNVFSKTKHLLGVALLSIGVIGLLLGQLELGVASVMHHLLKRIVFYLLCVAVSIPLLPLVDIQQ